MSAYYNENDPFAIEWLNSLREGKKVMTLQQQYDELMEKCDKLKNDPKTAEVIKLAVADIQMGACLMFKSKLHQNFNKP